MCVGYQGHGGVLGSVEQTQAKFNLLGTSTMMAVMLQVAMAPRRLRHSGITSCRSKKYSSEQLVQKHF